MLNSALQSFNRLMYYREGLSVERMHTKRHLIPYSNGHHSSSAAIIGMLLCELNNIPDANVIKALLLHDVHESYTGDIPGCLKVNHPDIKNCLNNIERKWENMHLPYMPRLTDLEKAILFCSDKMELLFHWVDERRLGNQSFTYDFDLLSSRLQGYESIIGVSEFLELLKKDFESYGR